jgi:hypothetical protein
VKRRFKVPLQTEDVEEVVSRKFEFPLYAKATEDVEEFTGKELENRTLAPLRPLSENLVVDRKK